MDAISIGTVVLAITALIGLVYQHVQLINSQKAYINELKADHLQKRRAVALSLWDAYSEMFNEKDRRKLNLFFEWLEIESDFILKRKIIGFLVKGVRCSKEDLNALDLSNSAKDVFGIDSLEAYELESLKNIIEKRLEIANKIGVSYYYHIADQEIIDSTLRYSITDEVIQLKDIIELLRKESNTNSWLILTDLVFHGSWGNTKEVVSKPAIES